jgi:hypothetical protein
VTVTAPGGFSGQVRALLQAAAEIYAGTPAQRDVAELASRLDGPLRVAIAGMVKAGKSTLLNALVGEELAPTDAGECTRVVWWFHDGLTYRAIIHPRSGPARPAPFSRDDGALDVDLEGVAARDIERLEVEWPSQALRTVTLIDTPGFASATPGLSEVAEGFLAPGDGAATAADAVIYLMRHLHSSDMRFLESFHDDEAAQATPVNTIAVLSRADELGVAHVDAMGAAGRIARRYRDDRRLRRVCQAVVPIAGLLAQGAVTMRESDYRRLRQLDALPVAERDELLISVDRFSLRPSPVPPADRAVLLRRFGIFGVRVALKLIREGSGTSAPELARALVAESGLDQLRNLLSTQFSARRDLLKGRATLVALETLAERYPRAGSTVITEGVERIRAGAHELVEIRLLNALRAGAVAFSDAEVGDAERLLGIEGMDVRSRLGLVADAGETEVTSAFTAALARWQRRAENPLASPGAVEAAEVLVRTCEVLAGTLAAARTEGV